MAGLNLTVTLDKRRLDSLSQGLRKQLQDVVTKTAYDIERTAKEIPPPIDTGATMASIHVSFNDGRSDYSQMAGDAARRRPGVKVNPVEKPSGGDGLSARIGPATAYAPYLEFGLHNRPPRPFMTPAVERNRRPFQDAIAHLFREGVR